MRGFITFTLKKFIRTNPFLSICSGSHSSHHREFTNQSDGHKPIFSTNASLSYLIKQ